MQGRQIICRRLGYWSGCRKVFEQPPHCEILRLSLRSAICLFSIVIWDDSYAVRGWGDIFEIIRKYLPFFFFLCVSFFLFFLCVSFFFFLRAHLFQKDRKCFLETKFRLSGVTTVCIKALLPRVYIGRSARERRQSE